jgi:hypothetical protein
MGDNRGMKRRPLAWALLATLPGAACAVSLNADGLGQALIFPYYTVQSSAGNPFNTYVSVVNHARDAKALRVRVREARNSREVASFNLFLSPNDMWTGAIVPAAGGAARLVSSDRSCTSPPSFDDAAGILFQNALYSGSFDDGNGAGLDRTREGWVEVIEMATLTGTSAGRVAQTGAGIPANCTAMQGNTALDVAAPTGGLSGTLTLINVTSGMDFTVNAEALAELGTRPFYRPAIDPYPDFNAVEIDPVSSVVANGSLYRSTWNRAADAVSAVLMRATWMGEFILDAGTQSRSDAVLTFPTRQYYFSGSAASAPFSACDRRSGTLAGQPATIRWFNRESAGGTTAVNEGLPPPPVANFRCSAATVLDFRNSAAHTQSTAVSGVLGSDNRAVAEGAATVDAVNGWFSVTTTNALTLTSLASSTRTILATGATSTGAHGYSGLPVVGFTVRTFVNGTLACSAGACQGNYGGSFPLKFRRSISPTN